MQTAFDTLIHRVATEHGVDPRLLQAIVCQESKGDPAAHRLEEHYVNNPVVRQQARAWSRKWGGTPTAMTELYDRASSWGLTQIMGQTARERGYDARYLPELAVDAAGALALSCRLLRQWGARATDEGHLIAMWNGGPGVHYPALPEAVAEYVAKIRRYMQESPYGGGG